jgi:hypothetical protein
VPFLFYYIFFVEQEGKLNIEFNPSAFKHGVMAKMTDLFFSSITSKQPSNASLPLAIASSIVEPSLMAPFTSGNETTK